MKATTKFIKLYYKIPLKSRDDIVFKPYGKSPRNLKVIMLEVMHNTPLSEEILKTMGFEDD